MTADEVTRDSSIDDAHVLAVAVARLLRDLPGVGSLRSEQARADWLLN
jgi:hypothetical protein